MQVANGKWSAGLFFVETKLAHAYYHMGGHASKNIRSARLHFVQGLMKGDFHTGRGKSFLQCEFFGSRWIMQIVRHSNEAGDSTAGT